MDGIPWDELPHDDYGPGLLATIWTLAFVAGAFIALRLYCKFSRGRGLWADDHFLIASWLALLALGVFITICVSYDFGKHNWDITPGNWSWLLLYANLSGSFSIIAAAWSKTSFALTLLRIARESSDRWMRYVIWFIIISINIALGLAVLFTWIQCWPVEKTWRTASTPGTCWPKRIPVTYNIFTASYSGAMDIVLAMLPWKMIWGLTMTRREKIGVLVAMSMGIFAGAVSFIKIRTIAAIGAFDIIDTVELTIWGAAESAVTIIAATLPILRALFRDFTPAPARFATNEESMIRRLGTASQARAAVSSPQVRRSRSDLKLVEWHDNAEPQSQIRGYDLELRPWPAQDSKSESGRNDSNAPANMFVADDIESGNTGTSRALSQTFRLS
ncbi:hypothetical protein CCHL11_08084 [Colletotrichum chlorophyti]|uniref:Rhodopsin domain-containing protein n=1 Tax=Colletotrichum chlorophyti TaxID=708187 RepID=A0A1Q8RMA9_9PEZI|nr:hypothetical protein CCHL11_08084 [Colletotrichum chlorophyti]